LESVKNILVKPVEVLPFPDNVEIIICVKAFENLQPELGAPLNVRAKPLTICNSSEAFATVSDGGQRRVHRISNNRNLR
jgi:hypothetical protein